MKPFLSPRKSAATVACTALLGIVGTSPAIAADGDVEVVNAETVQAYLSSTGDVESQRIYEQLALTGNGSVDLANPVETSGLRNLDGFGGFDVEDGKQLVRTSVDGTKDLRAVSDYKGKLPLELTMKYTLDGKTVEPGDVVGKDGLLEVEYTVKNVTGLTQSVTFEDGNGDPVTKDVTVQVPLVGQLSTLLPSSFRNVTSKAANMAGDGQGGTKLSFTMTLFPPIGSDTATFGYTAQITNGVIPRAAVQVLPVDPLASPTFATAATSYQGGAATGAALTQGATLIDSNLLKLRDGAADLLAGLIQLRDGASELSAGLTGSAAPGAERLSAGSAELRDGLGRLEDGAGELADGAGELDDGTKKLTAGADKLSTGTGTAYAGAQKLTSGLKALSGGLQQLANADVGLPAAQDGIAQLQAGVDLIINSVGAADKPTTLIGGLVGLEDGLTQLQAGSGQVLGGLQQLAGANGLPAAKGGVDQVKQGLDESLAEGGSIAKLIGGLTSLLADPGCTQSPVCLGTVNLLIQGAQQSKADLTAAAAGLGQVSGGLESAVSGVTSQLIPGVTQLQGGLSKAKGGATQLKDGAILLKGGLTQVQGGLGELSVGITKAVAGVLQLSSGSVDAAAGGTDLSDGLGKLDAGAGELAGGADQLSDGTGRLADGAGQLADGAGTAHDGSQTLSDGAGRLANGLGDAADGSELLADGLETATGGAPQLVDGADQLSEEGTSEIVKKGDATAQTYGELFATLEQGAERAQTEKMIAGAPADAIGLAAYSFEIAGETGEGARNVGRLVGGALLAAAAAGVVFLRRRVL